MVADSLDHYLDKMLKEDASDLFLTVGSSPQMRIGNKINPIEAPVLEQADMDFFIDQLLSDVQKEEFNRYLELNIALAPRSGGRFRANFMRQQHYTGVVIRQIRTDIPSTDELRLPEIYKELIMEKRGLVLMVGAAGAGKSTSLASMLEHRNEHGGGHIITVEDPIEFVHEHKGCLFTQREIGIDTLSYSYALKNALRQSPDVILIGEIRDKETMENALLFCETGHLCVATLHASNSNQAIDRIVNFFPDEYQKQVLITLSQNLKAIVSQRLVDNLHGGRSLAVEILLNEGLVKELVEEGKIREIKDAMEKSIDQGMMTFDQSLLDLINNEEISVEVGLREADNPNNLRLRINQQRTLKEDEFVSDDGEYQVEDDGSLMSDSAKKNTDF